MSKSLHHQIVRRAREIITGVAKGGGNPDLQLRAVRYLGVMGTPENRQILEEVAATLADLSKDQLALVEKVMRDVLSPYRKQDVDEVMQIVKANGGLTQMHLAFYQTGKMNDNQRWHFWRLEGPGFVWNYRCLPHVHTFVHIAGKTA